MAAASEDRLRALLDATVALTSELSLDSLLQRIVETAAEITGAQFAALGVIDETGEALERFVTTGIDAETHAAIGALPRGGGILGVLIRDATPLRLPDLNVDARASGFPPNHPPMRTFLGVPILLRGVAYGNLYLTEKRTGDEFTAADEELVMLLAAQAAVAIDLSQRVARDMLRRVLAAQELERRRLALELHDETGQALTSILLGLRAIRAAPDDAGAEQAENDLRELIVGALQNVRALAVELRPSSLDDFGLAPALERLAGQSAIDVAVEVHLAERLAPDAETALYRFVQEALTNVVKHADATKASVVIGRRGHGVSAVVEDDGRGFDPADVREDALGLVGMRERLSLLGGTLAIESRPGHGTSLIAFLP